MSVAKLKASNSQTAKSDEGNESLDTIIRHAIGKEPLLSFSRAGDSPVQWIQLLHALDQPDLPGWPLLSPLKVQMQKCDKCSREFCSPINHRRHVRVDHRHRKLDSSVDRDKLRAFWDELSLDKAKETVSFENAALEELAGSSIIASLTSLVKKQGLSSLPQACVKAGSALLGLVHGEFHERISSEKLFSILDDASEKTFLCGKAEAVQKYVFDGEARKIYLEKNVVACTSFLVEQKLVKAWHHHKDLEAMEAQESLLLEEDAAKESGKGSNYLGQARKSKPHRKLKKKDGKAKTEVKESTAAVWKTPPPAETTTISGSDSPPDTVPASVKPFQPSNMGEDVAAEAPLDVSGSDSKTYENVVGEAPSGSGCRHAEPGTAQNVERVTYRRDIAPRRQAPSKSRVMANVGFHGTHSDSRAAPIANVNKVWSPKPKLDVQKEAANQSEQNKKCEVFIVGSIPVTLGRSGIRQEDDYLTEHLMPKKNNVLEKPVKQISVRNGTHRSSGKHWRPVSRHETGAPLSVQNEYRESDASAADVIVKKGGDRDCTYHGAKNTPNFLSEGSSKDLSSAEVKAFLAQRWKEAIAADHLKLVLSPDLEPPKCSDPEVQDDPQIATAIPSKLPRMGGSLKFSSSAGAARSKSGKPEKGVTIRYIRKEKTQWFRD